MHGVIPRVVAPLVHRVVAVVIHRLGEEKGLCKLPSCG